MTSDEIKALVEQLLAEALKDFLAKQAAAKKAEVPAPTKIDWGPSKAILATLFKVVISLAVTAATALAAKYGYDISGALPAVQQQVQATADAQVETAKKADEARADTLDKLKALHADVLETKKAASAPRSFTLPPADKE